MERGTHPLMLNNSTSRSSNTTHDCAVAGCGLGPRVPSRSTNSCALWNGLAAALPWMVPSRWPTMAPLALGTLRFSGACTHATGHSVK